MGVYIGNGYNYMAMQGPCPDGFHVPTKEERTQLFGIMITTFGITISTASKSYLKIPFNGYRHSSTANVANSGNYGAYWSSTPASDKAYSTFFNSSNLHTDREDYRAFGYAIRPFGNSPIKPTSSRTTIYDGSGIAQGAGVFRNSSDGIISISGDGISRITIADKNLGATTVYSTSDTLSQNNCGNFYQWGNNYGFPYSGSVATTTTQVDASNYGPGNYYSFSTFRMINGDWSSVQNDNLRGYMQPAELRNAYIGDNS